MPNIRHWFPTVIYQEVNLFTTEKNKEWENICIDIRRQVKCGGHNWLGKTYTTLDTCDIQEDERFRELFDSVYYHIHQFAKQFNSTAIYKCTASWININDVGSFQESHYHSNSIFSAVYYISVPEDSGYLVFEDPREPEMLPIRNIEELNELSYTRARYKPTEGSLIVFRSNLRHLVEPATNTKPRISIAFNFI
jgi:uncharacterized protein (TIGR02466 family)